MVSAQAVIERLRVLSKAVGELAQRDGQVSTVTRYAKGYTDAMSRAILVIQDEVWPQEDFE